MPVFSAPPPPPPVRPRDGRRRRFRLLCADPRGLRRSREERMLAGVAGAVALRVGVDPTPVRIGFVLLTIFGGIGCVLYLAGWLLIPAEGQDEPMLRAVRADRAGLGLATAVLVAVGGAGLVAESAGLAPSRVLWPASLSAAGLVLVWRNAAGEDREVLRRVAAHLGIVDDGARRRRPGATALRVAVGIVLVLGGAAGVFRASRHLMAGTAVVTAALAVVAGFVIVFGPWWLRLGRELAAERRERVRSQERAEMAAHLHDSVLQTLALIQRSSTNPREVVRLARAQEKELRSWLFDQRRPGAHPPEEADTVAAAANDLERDVELRYGVAVDAVVVGDAPLDEDLRALLAAAREATVNAAKWSGADAVSVYVEVEPTRVSVFVRDRGRGFALDEIGRDRQGIRESIRGRVERRGGKTAIRSAPGAGTEVELVMPRRPEP